MVGRLAAGYLISHHVNVGMRAVLWTVSVPTLVWLVCLLATLPMSHERLVPVSLPRRSLREALSQAFAVDLKTYPAFGRWFVNRALFWGAFIAVNTFLLFYLMDVVGLGEAEGQRFVGQLSAVLGVALVGATIPSGYLADRIGRRPLLISAGVMAAAGTSLVLVARSLVALTACGVLIGVGAWFAAPYGIAAVSAAVVGANIVHYSLIAHLVWQSIGFGPLDYLKAFRGPLSITAASVAAALLLRTIMLASGHGQVIVLLMTVLPSVLVALLLAISLPFPELKVALHEYRSFYDRAKSLIARR